MELILLGVGILLLLLLFVVKRRLDAPEETATAESRTETMEGKKQEETIQNMEQENAAFLNSKKEEQKETTAAGPVQIRVLLTDCGKLGYAQKQVSPFHRRTASHSARHTEDTFPDQVHLQREVPLRFYR